ncbi:zonular occludens toxin domain-containing protein [Ralstonia sp.]|uniref:zonular occludens toxin domain-containing protein n=1 Tax=Ralstonia sp. TaxID=54061 RepID=UPI002D00A9BC|nr:zonular occludens toxin domain-containing protein [Ralstonia sp.]HWV03917.1 zonular occludens toxin domain-containing protein [Ralstonia sp.]
MIIFYEGLPRAGKSYTAVTKDILDALRKGRAVVTNVDGFDLDMAARLTELSGERVRELVKVIGDDDMPRLYEHVVKDALYVLDEAQDYWPSSFKPLDKPMTKFVTQHGHDGIDIILMGQDLNDVHNIWKRRIDRKYVFQKKDVVGKPNEFKWTVFKKVKGQRGDRFEKVSDGSGQYEEKYFGLYKSHTDGTTNTDTLEDDNANVFKSKAFRMYLPMAGLFIFCCVCFLVYLFKFGGLQKMTGGKADEQAGHTVTTTTSVASTPPVPGAAKPVDSSATKAGDPVAAKDDDFIAALAKKYRPRLEGWARKSGRASVLVGWYDDSSRIRERLPAEVVEELGWKVQQSEYGQHVILSKGDQRIVVTMWPIDLYGKVPDKQLEGVRAAGGGSATPDSVEAVGGVSGGDGRYARAVVDMPPSVQAIPDSSHGGSDWPGYGADGLIPRAKPTKSIL